MIAVLHTIAVIMHLEIRQNKIFTGTENRRFSVQISGHVYVQANILHFSWGESSDMSNLNLMLNIKQNMEHQVSGKRKEKKKQVVSHVVVSLLLSVPPLLPASHSMTSPLFGISDFWLVETGLLCRHSPIAHSSADLGVVLRISFAAGPISPLRNSVRGKKIERIRVFRTLATFSLCKRSHVPLWSSWFRADSSVAEGGVGFWLDFSGEEACGLCSFISSVGSLCWNKSMGAQISKTAGKEEAAVEQPAEGAAVAAKTNGQVVLWAFLLLKRMIQILIAHAEFCLNLAMCCVNGVLNVPCSASPRSPAFRESGHM